MIELIVVVLIILIIGAIAVSSVRSGTANGSLATGRTLARSIAEGVEQFQRDHGGRPPRAVTSADWSKGSPVDVANGSRPYVRASAIEPLATGNGFVLLDGTATAAPSRYAIAINYVHDQQAGLYALVVRDLVRGRPECHVTNAGTDGAGTKFVNSLPTRRPC